MGEITIRQAQVKKRPRRETKICCGAPRRQRGAPSLKCTTRITWSSARLKNEDHLLPKYGVNHFGMWCRRRESNDTRLLILRNLLQTYERKNRTTRCMPASYVQNHVQQIGRGSLFNTVSDASGYSVRTEGFARYRDLSSQVSPRATIFRVTKERWAQIGITTEFL